MDEYTGVLYPLIVKICCLIPFIPYQIPIYLIQLSLGIGSVYHFVHSWVDRKVYALVCALWINTIPFVAQAHVTVLPHSLAMTGLVIMILPVLKGSVHRRTLTVMEWAELICAFVILAQLDRAYLLPGMICLVWASVLQLYNVTHKIMMCSVSLFCAVGMLIVNFALYDVVQTPGYYGRIQRTVASTLFQRTGLITLNGKYHMYLPEEVQEAFSGDDLDNISRFPYMVETEFGPLLEARYGAEKAKQLYMDLAMFGLNMATKDIVVDITEETIYYAFPLIAYNVWQETDLEGSTSWNYQQFLGEAPVVATNYIRVANVLWCVLLGSSVLTYVLWGVKSRKFGVRIWVPTMGTLILYAACFAMGGMGTFDYKVALLPMILSYAPIACLAFQFVFKEG